MSGYVNVSNFKASRDEDIKSLLSDLARGGVFETLEDIGKVLSTLAEKKDLDTLDKVMNYFINGDVTPKPYIVANKCPVCGHVTFVNDEDYKIQAEFCLVCGTSDNQFMHWDDLRADSEHVMIWNVYFDGTSVEDIATLERVKSDLESGLKPDKVKPLIPRKPWFRNAYLNEDVIRPTMSEYNKFEKTFMLVYVNGKDEEARALAKDILDLLRNVKTEELVEGSKHSLTRLALS